MISVTRHRRPSTGLKAVPNRQKLKDAAKPLREPNKLQRLRQAAITSLPYHPEYLDQGPSFDATLLDAIRTPTPLQPTEVPPLLGDNYLHLRDRAVRINNPSSAGE
jgi:hypothetical protein